MFTNNKWQWVAAGLLLVVVTPLVLSGFWTSRNFWGISDWDYYFSLHESYRTIILKYHQLPLWNPYICGGTAGLADPEFSVFTPTFLLELIFGVPTGLRLAIYFSTIIGGLGMLLLAKRLHLSALAALLTAGVYALGSVNLLEIVEGHVNIFAAMWLPWILWSFLGAYRTQKTTPAEAPPERRAQEGRVFNKKALLCGVFLSLTFYQGGIYLLFYTAIAFFILPLFASRPRAAYKITLFAGAWALGFSAFKLIPVFFWLREFPDTAYASSTFTLPYLHHILLGRYLHGAEVLPQQGSGWHEYGAYIGYAALLVALLGAYVSRKTRIGKALLATTVIALLISSAGPLLKPLFDVAPFIPRSNISRVILFAIIPLCVLAGTGLDWLHRKKPWGKTTAFVLFAVAAIELTTLSFQLSRQAFVVPPPLSLPSSAPSPIAYNPNTYPTRVPGPHDKAGEGTDYTRSYAAILAGYGTLNYCTSLGPTPHVRTIYDEGETGVASLPPAIGTTEVTRWSPNQLEIKGEATQATRLLLNMNYARGWLVNGKPTREAEGRVMIPLSAGTFTLLIKYTPPGMILGLIVSLLTLLCAGVITRRSIKSI